MRAGGDPTVMGDVVNTAQRLEKLGEPGEVIVGPATEAATRDAIRYEPLGPQALRGPRGAGRGVPRGRRARRRPAAAARASRRRSSAATPSSRRSRSVVADGDDPRAGAHLVLLVGRRRRRQEPARERARRHRARASSARACSPASASPTATRTCSARSRRRCARRRERRRRRRRDRPARRASREQVTRTCSSPDTEPAEIERVVEGLLFLIEGIARPGVDPSRARDEALRSALAFFEALAATGAARARALRPALGDRRQRSSSANGCSPACATSRSCSSRPRGPTSRRAGRRSPASTTASRSTSTRSTSEATGELVRALLDGDADDETVDVPARAQRRQPVLRRGARRLRAGVGRQRSRMREVPGDAARAARGPPRRARSRRALAARRLRDRRRQRADRGRRSRSPTAPTRRQLLDRLAERDLHRARRRRVPLQVRAHPRDRVRHAHQGRARPPPRAWSRRCSTRAASRRSTRSRTTSRPRPSSSPSSARSPASRPTCASRPSPRSMRAAERAERVESWVAAGRHHDRALASARRRRTRARRAGTRCSDGREAACSSACSTTARDDIARPCSPRRRDAGDDPPAGRGAHAARRGRDRGRRLRRRRGDLRRGARAAGASSATRRAAPTCCASSACRISSAAISCRPSASCPRRSARSARRATERGAAWALQNLAWISFSQRRHPAGRGAARASRPTCSASSATGAGSAGPTDCSRSSATTRAASTKPPRSPSTSRSKAARPATAGPSA